MSDTQRIRERFWRFFEQNHRDLLIFAGRHATADYPDQDLLGDAFLFAALRLDPAKCDKWLAWLHRIIFRLRVDWYRRRVRAPVALAGDIAKTENTDLIDNASGETLSPSELVEHSGDAEIVKQALARMQNEQQCRVLELVLDNFANYGEPNLKKVAEDMNISPSNAKQLYQRAKKALKHSLCQLAKEMNILTERPNHEH